MGPLNCYRLGVIVEIDRRMAQERKRGYISNGKSQQVLCCMGAEVEMANEIRMTS